MDKKAIVQELIKDRTVIRCLSRDEETELREIMTSIFPQHKRKFDDRMKVFGANRYEFDVVYRVEEYSPGSVEIGFCTKKWYLAQGYKVVDLSEINFSDDLGLFDTNSDDLLALIFADN